MLCRASSPVPTVTFRWVSAATTTLAPASRPAGTVVLATAIEIAATVSAAAVADATTVPISGPGLRCSPASIQRISPPPARPVRPARAAPGLPAPAPGQAAPGRPGLRAGTPPDRKPA